MKAISKNDMLLADEVAAFYADPYGFVMFAFEWGSGALEGIEGPDDWQVDTLKTIGEQVRLRGFDGVNPVDPIQLATASGHGIGKMQVLDCIVETPTGARRWGDLKAGDLLFDEHGAPVKILQRHPVHAPECMRVTFDDGSYTDVAAQHLWNVRGRQERRNGVTEWRTLETQEILALGVKRSNGKAEARQWEIPVQGAAQFPEAVQPVHPYMVGVWLGDGTKGMPRYSKPYPEVADRIEKVCGYAVTRGTGNYVRGIKAKMDDPVFSNGSHERYIPDWCKYASVEQRTELFRGLCDSDGEAHASGSIGYSTTSERLAHDVVWLARSLGCKAMIHPTPKRSRYRGNDGALVECRDCYRVTINAPFNPFSIAHKQSRYKPSEERYLKRWIDSIEPIGRIPGMCVTVDSDAGLYLANDFIVTHNSALTAWIVLWIMSTRPHAKGVITANTGEQLRTKTLAELAKWRKLCITGHWFDSTTMSMSHKAFPETWRVDAQTCREENSEAFAGLHAADSTPFYIFDEASAVPEAIWEVAKGGLTDGEPMWFVWGNPTRNAGSFRDCFGRNSHRWITRQIDSRDCRMPNKKLIQQYIDDYGEDSDFVRVRVRGRFPKAGDMQLIPNDVVYDAQKRGAGRYLGDDPLICGIDVARGGDDDCRIEFRRGKDAISEKKYKIPGEVSRDSMRVVSLITTVLDRHKPDIVFLDGTGIGGPIADRLVQLGYPVTEIHFGSDADDKIKFKNKAAEMWSRMLRWLMDGGSISDDPRLEQELTGREFGHNDKDQLVLERKKDMKTRGLPSPDWADALALTFAQAVPPRQAPRNELDMPPGLRDKVRSRDYDPLEQAEKDLIQYDD